MKIIPVLVLWFVLEIVGMIAASAEQAYTDEMVKDLFSEKDARDIHAVMIGQRRRVAVLQDGFLLGDASLIEKAGKELAEGMRDVQAKLPPDKSTGEAWAAMSYIVRESESMEAEIVKKDYKKAYNHYASLIGQCIRCHQVTRDWGRFEEPQAENAALTGPGPEAGG